MTTSTPMPRPTREIRETEEHPTSAAPTFILTSRTTAPIPAPATPRVRPLADARGPTLASSNARDPRVASRRAACLEVAPSASLEETAPATVDRRLRAMCRAAHRASSIVGRARARSPARGGNSARSSVEGLCRPSVRMASPWSAMDEVAERQQIGSTRMRALRSSTVTKTPALEEARMRGAADTGSTAHDFG